MSRKRVAVIGGGIFGAAAGIVLGERFDITLFERRDGLLGEATYANQYRHHYGYHYPRSADTVQQCLLARKDFEDIFGDAIVRGFPAYYAVAREGSRTTPEDFLAFCKRYHLDHAIEYPAQEFLRRERVSLSVRTSEPVYDHDTLREIATRKLARRSVAVKLTHAVVAGRVAADSRKVLTVQADGGTYEDVYDYAVNATYANLNVFCEWFEFPRMALEFRLKEIVVVALPTPELLATTIVDGPFVTLVPMGQTALFTLGDVPRSVHDVRRSSAGQPWTREEIAQVPSRWREILHADAAFVPIVERATYVRSMWSILPVRPDGDATDARPTEVISHGTGCWSVFEGKIITCVGAARRILAEMSEDGA